MEDENISHPGMHTSTATINTLFYQSSVENPTFEREVYVGCTISPQPISEAARKRERLIREDPKQFYEASPWGMEMMPKSNPHFVGRQNELQELKTAFTNARNQGAAVVIHHQHAHEESSNASSTSQHPCLAQGLTGMGGVGKTQLAAEYIYRLMKEEANKSPITLPQTRPYAFMVWLQGERVGEDLIGLARWLGLAFDQHTSVREIAQLLYEHLAKLSLSSDKTEPRPRVLFVLDGGHWSNSMKGLLPSPNYQRYFHWLITSREQQAWEKHFGQDVFKSHLLAVFSEADALAYFKKAFIPAVKDNPADYTEENLKTLAKNLGYLPLALAQAQAYINRHSKRGRGIKHYLNLLEEQGLHFHLAQSVDDYPWPIAATWLITLAAIAKESPVTVELLLMCGYVMGDNIPYELLYAYGNNAQKSVVWQDTVEDAIDCLANYSLLEDFPQRLFVRIHPLVQEVLRSWASGELMNKITPEALSHIEGIDKTLKNARVDAFNKEDVRLNTVKRVMKYGFRQLNEIYPHTKAALESEIFRQKIEKIQLIVPHMIKLKKELLIDNQEQEQIILRILFLVCLGQICMYLNPSQGALLLQESLEDILQLLNKDEYRNEPLAKIIILYGYLVFFSMSTSSKKGGIETKDLAKGFKDKFGTLDVFAILMDLFIKLLLLKNGAFTKTIFMLLKEIKGSEDEWTAWVGMMLGLIYRNTNNTQGVEGAEKFLEKYDIFLREHFRKKDTGLENVVIKAILDFLRRPEVVIMGPIYSHCPDEIPLQVKNMLSSQFKNESGTQYLINVIETLTKNLTELDSKENENAQNFVKTPSFKEPFVYLTSQIWGMDHAYVGHQYAKLGKHYFLEKNYTSALSCFKRSTINLNGYYSLQSPYFIKLLLQLVGTLKQCYPLKSEDAQTKKASEQDYKEAMDFLEKKLNLVGQVQPSNFSLLEHELKCLAQVNNIDISNLKTSTYKDTLFKQQEVINDNNCSPTTLEDKFLGSQGPM